MKIPFDSSATTLKNIDEIPLNEYIAYYTMNSLNKSLDKNNKDNLYNQDGLVNKIVNKYIDEQKDDSLKDLINLKYIPFKKYIGKDKKLNIAFITAKTINKGNLSPDNIESNIRILSLDNTDENKDMYNKLKVLDNSSMYPYNYKDINIEPETNNNQTKQEQTNSTTSETKNSKQTKSNESTNKNKKTKKLLEPVNGPEIDIDMDDLNKELSNEFRKENNKYLGKEEDIKKIETKVEELGKIKEQYKEANKEVFNLINKFGLNKITTSTKISTIKGKFKRAINKVDDIITNVGELDELNNIKKLLVDYRNKLNGIKEIDTKELLSIVENINKEIFKIENKCK